MKSYTDLEQSKKLAEILSIESADMCYPKDAFEYHYAKEPVCHYSGIGLAHPCWSLAALIDVLPLEVEAHKQTDGHKIYYYVESYMKRNGKEIYQSTERHENLIDACYEMILKLHKQNLL